MRGLSLLFAALLVAALPAPAGAQFFTENFDSYAPLSDIAGQGGWETWGGAPGANTYVTTDQSYSPSNSLFVAGAADIVHQFAGVNSGIWYAKAMTYVPSTQAGEMFFIMLNLYDGACAAAGDCDWSVQVAMCQSGCLTTGVDPGLVTSLRGSGMTVPSPAPSLALITNQWVEIRSEINFGTNQVTTYYNNVLLDTHEWTVTGGLEMQAFDLFSNSSSVSYMDNIWLDITVPVELVSFTAD